MDFSAIRPILARHASLLLLQNRSCTRRSKSSQSQQTNVGAGLYLRNQTLAFLGDRQHDGDGTIQKPGHYLDERRTPRNLFFLSVVLAHGFRRLLPPY
jgi:hypothetical protein